MSCRLESFCLIIRRQQFLSRVYLPIAFMSCRHECTVDCTHTHTAGALPLTYDYFLDAALEERAEAIALQLESSCCPSTRRYLPISRPSSRQPATDNINTTEAALSAQNSNSQLDFLKRRFSERSVIIWLGVPLCFITSSTMSLLVQYEYKYEYLHMSTSSDSQQ